MFYTLIQCVVVHDFIHIISKRCYNNVSFQELRVLQKHSLPSYIFEFYLRSPLLCWGCLKNKQLQKMNNYNRNYLEG